MSVHATQPTPTLPRDLTIAEVCAELRLSRPTVYNLIRSGQLPAYRVGRGGRYRVTPAALERYKVAHRVAHAGEETDRD